MYPKNAASPPRIAIGAVVQISDGAVQTSGVAVVVRPEGGAESAGGGTIAYSAASGVVYYTPTQAETNYTAFCVIAYKTGCIPAQVTVVTTASSTAGTVELDSDVTDQLDVIESSIAAYIAGIASSASLTPGTIVGFPETLNIGDSYTDDCDSAIHVFIRDENDDPITAVGTHDFTDGDFAPECIITLNGNTGRVNCTVTYVTASPENYLKIQIPSKESRRATAGIATVQVLLKWDGAQKALSKQTVTWDGLI